MTDISTVASMALRNIIHRQRLPRRPETSSVMVAQESVDQFDRIIESNVAITYCGAIELLNELEGLQSSGSALDLACGPGHFTLFLAKYGGFEKVIGLDSSEPMLEKARRNAKRLGLSDRVEFVLGDARSMPHYHDRRFDLITCTNSAHHLPTFEDLQQMLCEMDRLMSESGTALVVDLTRLKTSACVRDYVRTFGKEYLSSGLDRLYEDFSDSMYAAWTPDELRSAAPMSRTNRWHHFAMLPLPYNQFLFAKHMDWRPRGRKRGFLWTGSQPPLRPDLEDTYKQYKQSLFLCYRWSKVASMRDLRLLTRTGEDLRERANSVAPPAPKTEKAQCPDAHDSTSNVTGWSKAVAKVHRPTTVDEVRELVRSARSSRTALYPVSKGFNWGYGSASPVTDQCELVDLSRMNRILNAGDISVDHPVAIVEPGVTQRQLYEFLQAHCPELTFNVTGAGLETSIIGNALDRGVGYMGPRKEDLFGLEVVTGTGELLRTGFRRLGDSSPLASSHPYGLGPMLDGLFSQSNFGIVTSACFRLSPRRPKETAISLALRRADDLPRFIDELTRLKRDGLLTSVSHVGNRARTHSTLSVGIMRYLMEECGLDREAAASEADRATSLVVTDEWVSLAAITGSAGQVKAALREIRRRMNGVARMVVMTDRIMHIGSVLGHSLRFVPLVRAFGAAVAAMRPLHKLAVGVPTDIAIENLMWKFQHANYRSEELDKSRCGLLFINPALPMDGKFVARFLARMNATAAEHGHTLYTTLNIETSTSLVAIINLLFDRTSPEEVERAHRCSDAMLDCMRAEKIEPYRARADMMGKIVAADPDYWRTIRSLKQVFDPDNIIAPGRYNLP